MCLAPSFQYSRARSNSHLGPLLMLKRSFGFSNQLVASAKSPHMTPHLAASKCSNGSGGNLFATATWEGEGSQLDFMEKDTCILVDDLDRVIGQASKRAAHIFSEEQPKGMLHRAFSVFLFNSQGKLLLQQRASSKLTFPGVWANTCCSHPLSGFEPSEVDTPEAVRDGSIPGTKLAAVRKLGHELGIPAHQVPLQGFRYLTRLHYCAADPQSAGGNPQWGEHEMDYILFTRADVDVNPNPEEVSEIKYVTLPELKVLMHPGSRLTWSPWFKILVENHLEGWWGDLQHTLNHDQAKEWCKIYKIE